MTEPGDEDAEAQQDAQKYLQGANHALMAKDTPSESRGIFRNGFNPIVPFKAGPTNSHLYQPLGTLRRMFAHRQLYRRKTAVFMVLSLLLSQLALASYLCPAESPPQNMATLMAAGVPCDEIDKTQPALCHQHVADASQVMQAAPILAAPRPVVLEVLWASVALVADAMALPSGSAPEPRPPPDPLFLATLRLRV